ncbi:MAG: hypothetical protein MUO21_10715, partial [Nitrososphaeraceae archaeon]|nr:hypothetical protein [Nitrososphaeraceae archaeon]
MKPKLYLVSSDDIVPFTEETLCQVNGEKIMTDCKKKFSFNWGDAIQIGTDYRNQNKYFWDDGFH